MANDVLPGGYSISWAGTLYQGKRLQNKGSDTTLFAVIFIFLILAAGVNSRHIIGTTVARSILSATMIGVLFIPLFSIWLQI